LTTTSTWSEAGRNRGDALGLEELDRGGDAVGDVRGNLDLAPLRPRGSNDIAQRESVTRKAEGLLRLVCVGEELCDYRELRVVLVGDEGGGGGGERRRDAVGLAGAIGEAWGEDRSKIDGHTWGCSRVKESWEWGEGEREREKRGKPFLRADSGFL
jgi:hypothetical protein